MSAPLYISKDDLREQENFNYSAIDQYWADKGYTEEYVRSQYKLMTISKSLFAFHGWSYDFSYDRHSYRWPSLLCHHVVESKKDQPSQTSRQKTNDWLGKRLPGIQAWPGSGN